MDIERLTARNKNGLAYLVKVKPNEQEVDSPYKNTLKCILDCFERLAQYEEAEIAKQSVIAKSATSEEVQRAIEQLKYAREQDREFDDGTFVDSLDLAITALQAYQPWIPCTERMPTDGTPVLITYVGFNDGKFHSDGVATWSIEENGYNGGWLWEIDGSEATVEITHWKPLPEPPKGE